MASMLTKKPLTTLKWVSILLAMQVIYLILELAFNARLVDSVMVADAQYFEHLAYLGRLLSGAGCTLLGFSLLRKWQAKSTSLRVAAHALTAAIAFPAVYYGQEMIIDALVDSSSAEQRVHAQYIALLKRGLASNTVVFKDVEFTPEDLERPQAKTFINTIGFAVFFAPDYIQSVAENSDQILTRLAYRQANEQLPTAYGKYLQARDKIHDLSVRYNDANAKLEEQSQAVAPQAQAIWLDTYNELEKQWESIRTDSNSHKLKDAFDQLYDRLDIYFTARNRCTGSLSSLCLKKVNQEYHKTVDPLFDRVVEPDYWCKPLPMQKSTVMQGTQFVEIEQSGQLDCSSKHLDFIQTRFLNLYGLSSFGYENFEMFLASEEVANKLRARLAEQDINMPESYRLRDPKGFILGIESELTRHLEAAFLEKTKEQFGVAIKPRLSTEAFLKHPLVQTPIREALELDSNSAPVAFDLSERAFHEQVLVPNLEKKLALEREKLLARTEFFADGKPYAEEGKMAVRSVLVPPIAMGLSLFFGLLNLGGLTATLLSRSRLPAPAVKLCKLAFLVAVLVVPLALPSEIARTESLQKVVVETQTVLGPGRYYVSWLTSLQPLVHPLGASLANVFGLFRYQP